MDKACHPEIWPSRQQPAKYLTSDYEAQQQVL